MQRRMNYPDRRSELYLANETFLHHTYLPRYKNRYPGTYVGLLGTYLDVLVRRRLNPRRSRLGNFNRTLNHVFDPPEQPFQPPAGNVKLFLFNLRPRSMALLSLHIHDEDYETNQSGPIYCANQGNPVVRTLKLMDAYHC